MAELLAGSTVGGVLIATTEQATGVNTGDETAARIGTLIDNAAAKTTPADADLFALSDSVDSSIVKKITFADIKGALSGVLAPVSHTHGNITNAGAIGSTANIPIITGTSGVLKAGSFGSAANTFCQGNDARLSDARTPLAHNQAASTITDFAAAALIAAPAETATTIGMLINGATAKTTPVDADMFAMADSAASNVVKKFTFANLKTALGGVLAPAVHTQTASTITDFDTEVSNNADVAADTAARHNHTNKTILDNITASYTTTEQTKLSGIAANANNYSLPVASAALGGVKSGTDITVDASGNVSVNDDSHNHIIGNVDGLQTALDGKISATLIGAVNGVAGTDSNGKVPAAQLPSYVDDVIEGYFNPADSLFYAEATFVTPIPGESSKIYTDLTANIGYRWGGTVFTQIGSSLALGQTSTTAGRGDWTKIAYDHSQTTHAPSNAQANNISDVNATDLTDSGDTTLHYHSADRNRSNHTGTQTASTISDFTTAARTAAPAETTSTIGTLIYGATAKTTPVDADMFALADSAASNVVKKITFANLKTALGGVLAPAAHTHGNITNAGYIGSTSGVPIITGTSGILQAGSFGTASGTFCQGNDARLSDARTPLTHNQTASTITDFATAALTAAPAETVTTIGTLINGATAKTTPVDADMFALADSAASNVVKKFTFANLKTALGGVLAPAAHNQTASTITDFDTEVTNNTSVAANTAARHTHSNTTALNAVSGTNTGDETTTTLGTKIYGATAKTTPVDADMFALADSAASNVVKKITFANLKTALSGVLTPATHNQTASTITDFAATTRSTVLTGIDVGTAGTVSATDSILSAIGKTVKNLIDHIADSVKHITSGERTLWNTVSNKLDATANAVSASELATARTISLTGDVSGSTSFDGSANASITAVVADNSHNHDDSTITNLMSTKLVEPSYVMGNMSPTSKALFDLMRADRLAFLPADQIIVETSTDAGVTWIDAVMSDTNKRKLFTGQRPSAVIPLKNGVRSTDCMMRITITAMKYNVPAGTAETDKYSYWNSTNILSNERYASLSECFMYVSASTDKIYCKVEHATGASPNSWSLAREAYLTGWSGPDFVALDGVTFGGGTTQTGNGWNWRFTFRTCSPTNTFVDADLATTFTNQSQIINHIKATGRGVWVTPNRMMYHDHLYDYDESQNAYFPALIRGYQLVATAGGETPPLVVTSKSQVPNLNADLLDDKHLGLDSGDVMQVGSFGIGASSDADMVAQQITDANGVTTTGIYRVTSTCSNRPWTDALSGILFVSRIGASNYTFQEATTYDSAAGGIVSWSRFWNASVWSPWRKEWSENNDGSGSGLDADKLDGQEGSYYLSRVNHSGTQLASTISDFDDAALLAAPAETSATIAAIISGTTAEASLVDADLLAVLDSTASFALKKLTLEALRSRIVYTGTIATAAATAAKTVTLNENASHAPSAGEIYLFTFTSGSSVASVTIAANGGTARTLRLNGAAVNTTSFTIAAGGTVATIFDGTYFNVLGSQRTSDSDTYDRVQWSTAITAGAAIYSYKLLMQGPDGEFYPLTLETGTGTTKTVSTQPFLIDSPILFYNSTTTVAAAATTSSNLWQDTPMTSLNYTANAASWTSQLPIYLKGTINANGHFVLDNTTATSWLTQTLPTADDGFVYIRLGYMYSTTGLKLYMDHQKLQFKGGKIVPYIPSIKSQVSVTLAAASWTGASAPYTYVATVAGVTANSDQDLMPDPAVTLAQLKAFQAANIIGYSQTTNSVTLRAWGSKPTIDIPVDFIIRGDV